MTDLNLREVIDVSSKEWYFLGSEQVLIPIDALTHHGIDLCNQACERAEKEKPRRVIRQAHFVPVSAGSWCPEKDSVFYEKSHKPVQEYMADRVIYGLVDGNFYDTTKIRWQGTTTRGENWVITEKGTLFHYTEK